MILLTHNNETVIEIVDLKTNQFIENTIKNPLKALFSVANYNQNTILVWCHESLKASLDIDAIKSTFHLKNMMVSFGENQYLPEQIGYVEDSPFLKVNKRVKYPTWLMSSQVGAIYTSQLLKFESKINLNNTFDFALNVIAKKGMSKGLFCYSEPNLLKQYNSVNQVSAPISELFKFVKLNYKAVWSILLLINFIIYERKFPLIAFLKTFFIKKNSFTINFELEPISNFLIDLNKTIDVIIPTLGRKKYLYDVLIDLSNQTILPKQVIVVEQNNDKTSESVLDYIKNKDWPFKIIHEFIHQTGVCNARNLALQKVTANFVYLADDDNKFGKNLLKDVIVKMQRYKFDVISMSYLQENEIEKHKAPIQWSAFGGGSSILSTKFFKKIAFRNALEFGYGEDSDFGMQLRNLGADVIYAPDIKILHLKAPIGGFRTQFKHPWEDDLIQPKPSPTVMFYRKINSTKYQLLGYKTILFLKFYKDQSIKNPFKYISLFKKQWQVSNKWANYLSNTV
ncbi:glycosyltransferase family A protein [uncultured Algibacter sp.]|uniref:glycosyltransferase family 2 protein n=1 Tax=uncultured Algibacter sp. TaxID=298659 RepID=UPI002636D282|nr:glycosyltransferase family A protein [uncultured Algibacter sp.]